MNEEQLQAIEERRKGADMITIEDAVTTYPMHKMADAYFAEWVGNDVDALIAEVRSLRANLDAANVAWQEEHAARLVLAEQLKVAEAKAMFWWNEATHPNVAVQP